MRQKRWQYGVCEELVGSWGEASLRFQILDDPFSEKICLSLAKSQKFVRLRIARYRFRK
jgi:hypothetical protein